MTGNRFLIFNICIIIYFLKEKRRRVKVESNGRKHVKKREIKEIINKRNGRVGVRE
jgi:hypothetical protein